MIANILAGPLTQLAPAISQALAPGAMLVLSGLLHNQEKLVTSFYHAPALCRRAGATGPGARWCLEKPDGG